MEEAKQIYLRVELPTSLAVVHGLLTFALEMTLMPCLVRVLWRIVGLPHLLCLTKLFLMVCLTDNLVEISEDYYISTYSRIITEISRKLTSNLQIHGAKDTHHRKCSSKG